MRSPSNPQITVTSNRPVREFSPVSLDDLLQRRRQLRRQRSLKVVQSAWRTVLVTGLAVGLGWFITRPLLLVRGVEQIQVTGNEFLSSQVLKSLLPLSYPVSLFQVQPESLAHILETRAPIAKASVSRQLFPPQLSIQVQERRPVAQATHIELSEQNKPNVGFLDEHGLWIPVEVITNLDADLALPTLTVKGFRSDYQADWSYLYPLLQASPVEVVAVDWRDPNNLILQTDLGKVFCGSNRALFAQQLIVLDKLRNLRQQPEFEEIDFIDLRNPENPVLRVKQPVVPVDQRAQASDESAMLEETTSPSQL